MRVFVVPLVALGVVAGGYSDEPTEGQMKRAFESSLATQVHNVLEFVAQAGGPEAVEKIHQAGSDRFAIKSFRKLDCARAVGNSGYLCAFTVNVEVMNGNLERHINGRFSASSGSLAFAEEV